MPTNVQLSVMRGQLPPQGVGTPLTPQSASVDTQPQAFVPVAAQVSPAGHGPPHKPDVSGMPQPGMVDVVVLVTGGPAGAQRSGGDPGTTVRLPNWSTIGTGEY